MLCDFGEALVLNKPPALARKPPSSAPTASGSPACSAAACSAPTVCDALDTVR